MADKEYQSSTICELEPEIYDIILSEITRAEGNNEEADLLDKKIYQSIHSLDDNDPVQANKKAVLASFSSTLRATVQTRNLKKIEESKGKKEEKAGQDKKNNGYTISELQPEIWEVVDLYKIHGMLPNAEWWKKVKAFYERMEEKNTDRSLTLSSILWYFQARICMHTHEELLEQNEPKK